jgi:hypothetical protein
VTDLNRIYKFEVSLKKCEARQEIERDSLKLFDAENVFFVDLSDEPPEVVGVSR